MCVSFGCAHTLASHDVWIAWRSTRRAVSKNTDRLVLKMSGIDKSVILYNNFEFNISIFSKQDFSRIFKGYKYSHTGLRFSYKSDWNLWNVIDVWGWGHCTQLKRSGKNPIGKNKITTSKNGKLQQAKTKTFAFIL